MRNVDLNSPKTELLKSSLREAIISNNLDMINKILTQTKYDLYTPIDLNGLTLLHYAVQNGREKIVETLCTLMNDVNVSDNLGRTPLHYAAAKNEIGILRVLLISGANVNCQTIGGETPLMKAISFNRIESAKLLLRYGADVSLINHVSGVTAKELAFRSKSNELISLVCQYQEIYYKLCLIIYTYIYLKDSNRPNPLHKLSPNMIKQLTRFIIP